MISFSKERGVVKASALDIDLFAKTIYGEARGTSYEGKIAVAHVVLNRARRGGWWTQNDDGIPNDTIAAACIDPRQFSCWNTSDPNLRKIALVQRGDRIFQECEFIAIGAILGHHPDPTNGSCHYHGVHVLPTWAEGHTSVGTIGAHMFYNDIP
jgi:N-acetylmuramoyl-L-alanine amidase